MSDFIEKMTVHTALMIKCIIHINIHMPATKNIRVQLATNELGPKEHMVFNEQNSRFSPSLTIKIHFIERTYLTRALGSTELKQQAR